MLIDTCSAKTVASTFRESFNEASISAGRSANFAVSAASSDVEIISEISGGGSAQNLPRLRCPDISDHYS